MKSLQLLSFALILLTVLSCNKEEILEPTSYLSGQEFTKNLRVDGHEFDSLIIENCTFDGATLNIGNADYVTIRNCSFKNIKSNGIQIGFIGPSKGVTIENCTFENIGFNAIDSHEDAPDGIIRSCNFYNVALSQTGPAMAQPHHAIYWKGKNVLIEKNTFIAGNQPHGNGISVRSSGKIQQNRISGYPKNGIMYYANHPGGDSLFIENNFLWGNGYSITLGSLGDKSLHNKNVIIRFNSMTQSENYSLYVANDFETTTNIAIYGNIIVNPTQEYIKSFYNLSEVNLNLSSPNDVGFENMEAGDLHLTPGSSAHGFANTAPSFPVYDIDGDLRTTTINAGADE